MAPWFRTLAVVWAEGLRARGHDVRIVTTSQHFDPPPVGEHDVVLQHPWRSKAGLSEARAMLAMIGRWRPDVVVGDAMRDPRFLAPVLARKCPYILVTHDAVPHDAANRGSWLRRLNASAALRRATSEVVFSEHVRQALGERGHPLHLLPLPSEMPEAAVPDPVSPADRRDVVVVGRLSEYKNIPVILEAFERHRRSSSYRGDRLVLVGGGDPGCEIPGDVEWINGRFRFADVAPRIAAAKASLCVYSAGSQSGVQVLAMQCGTTSVVSEVGGLAEYLPPGDVPIEHTDVGALTARLDELADPDIAAERGRRHRSWYDGHYTPAAAAQAWEGVLEAAASRPQGRRGAAHDQGGARRG